MTNNHVISNLDTMPALRRVVQPGRLDGGILPADVIGSLKRHIQVNTVPNVPGPPAPVSAVDAAISTIEEDFTYDVRVLDVPVAFEVQAPAVEMNVQKVGRTTELTTNGSISTINLTLDIGYGPGSTLKGRIQNSFLIRSTDGNPFSDKGDSGSFVLNQVPGELEGTFPVVGLLYADGFDNTGSPITVANDINAVFGALNLTTTCTCIARAIIRAIFGVRSAEVREMRRFLSIKERQLRMFRSRLIQPGRFGRVIEEQITREAARVGKIIGEDEEAFGLLVNALRPLVEQPTNYDIMKTKLDANMLDNLSRFGSRISRRSPTLRPKVRLGKELLKEIEGNTVAQVLRAADLTFDPGEEPG